VKVQQLDGKQHVLQHRAPGQQNRALENDPDFPPGAGHFRIFNADFARAWIDESSNHHEQRALAATARTQDAEELAVSDVERQLADRFEVAEHLLQRCDAHDGSAITPTGSRTGRRRDGCRSHRIALLNSTVGSHIA